jgi:NAD(P)-dependent dehydrogenase (short-subunit alcohol dehydrogenase family)
MSELFDVSGKLVMVTGGAQGLGRMIAQGFVDAGARVIITSRKADAVEAAVEALGGPACCSGFQADLSSWEGCTELAERVLREHPKVDVLVNNAGRTWGEPLATFSERGWTSVMSINLQAPFALSRSMLPALKAAARESDPSRIINIGSITGSVVEPLNAYSYSASKAGLQHLSRVLAADLAEHSITVNSIVPGYFPTNMTEQIRDDEREFSGIVERVPLRRLGTPSDIIGASIMLASRAGAYMTGTELVVDGGMSGCR